ncbi:aspartate aminotransferase family protein [Patescibacteria group bacterium]|nr:aspartate aminotransferase family protein [Patescibacteria group bacterium]
MNYKYTKKEYLDKDRKYIFHSWGSLPLVQAEGKGCILKDINGQEYIDCVSQMSGPAGIGISHPRVVKAIKDQVEKLACGLAHAVNMPRVELAEKLAKITPPGMSKLFFATTGGESNEFALKTAMKITGKKEVISVYHAYHGATIALTSLGQHWNRVGPAVPGFRQIPAPYCYRCPYGKTYPGCNFECAQALEEMIQFGTYHDVAAFIMEPILGMGGHIVPPQEYFKIIREICDRYGLLFITDEIQTGFGKTGKMWAIEHYDVIPDIMVIGKAMGGGVPISAAVFKEDIVSPELEKDPYHVYTNQGIPLSCAAASAVIDVIVEENIPAKAEKMGEFWYEHLKELQNKHPLIGDIRAKGLFIGLELVKNRKTKERATQEALQVVEECLRQGVIFALSTKPGIGNVIKIKPAMIITEELSSRALQVLDKALEVAEKQR